MADPVTAMAAGSAGISLIGGVVGAMGSSAQSAGQAQQLRAKAQADMYNATAFETRALEAERNRGIAYAKSDLMARDERVKSRAVIGQVRAAYGASGLALDGSPLDVLQATAAEQELDVAKILYAGDLEALAETDKAVSFRQQAQLARMGASSAYSAASTTQGNAGFGIATSLLSGVSGAFRSFTPRPVMGTA